MVERRLRRRIRSIPPQTSLGGVTSRIGKVRGVRSTAGESDWSKVVVDRHRYKKELPGQAEARPKPLYERDGKIELMAEVVEDYNAQGDLGIILEFTGIELTKAPFLRSRHNRPDSPVFYVPINHNKRMARLFLATRGNIFNSQIVPVQMDVDPLFQEELYLSQLTTTHDPASMAVFQNNNLVIIGYNPRVISI